MDLQLGSTKALIDECRRQGLLRNQCAYVLATAFWETARTMKPVREMGGEKYLKSKKYYPYVGMGFVQLTWLKNYQLAEKKLGAPFVKNPKLLLDPKYAVPIAVTGMREGWFTGKKLSNYITLAKSDFVNARRIINGTDKAKEIAKLALDYDMDLAVTGYGPKKPVSARPAPAVTIPAISPKPAPAPVVVPVRVPGLEKPMVKSSTMWAALSGVGITGIASAKDAIDSLTGLDWRVTMAIVGLGAAFAAYWIISQRIKYRQTQRDMVAGIKAASAEQ